MFGALLDAGVGILTGAMAQEGAEDRNQAQIASAREQMAFQRREAGKVRRFNKLEARKNRAFQRYMSNSAVARQVSDMRSAGINPILAARYGGASSPGGSTATAGSVPPGAQASIEDSTGKGIAAGLAARSDSRGARMATQQMDNMKAQESLTKETAKEMMMRVEQTKANTAKSRAEAVKVTNEALESLERTENLKVRREQQFQEIERMEEFLKGQRIEGKIDESAWGEFTRRVKRLKEALGFSASNFVPATRGLSR